MITYIPFKNENNAIVNMAKEYPEIFEDILNRSLPENIPAFQMCNDSYNDLMVYENCGSIGVSSEKTCYDELKQKLEKYRITGINIIGIEEYRGEYMVKVSLDDTFVGKLPESFTVTHNIYNKMYHTNDLEFMKQYKSNLKEISKHFRIIALNPNYN